MDSHMADEQVDQMKYPEVSVHYINDIGVMDSKLVVVTHESTGSLGHMAVLRNTNLTEGLYLVLEILLQPLISEPNL
ncbi:hypothetical protein Taro_031341 [Colocasia esculenta]|uniref:Uncharacterized protein n=1 Tax=Colocasia esculenta TaxID=4460 RepID=A0A843VYS5_COLES|nr:hypothetical protein [Colocasia esculenta]